MGPATFVFEVLSSAQSSLQHGTHGGRSKSHVQGCSCRGVGSRRRSEKGRRVYDPWVGPLEDPRETGNEGGKEGSVWQAHYGQGEARTQNCQGIPSGCFEGEHLIGCIVFRTEPDN